MPKTPTNFRLIQIMSKYFRLFSFIKMIRNNSRSFQKSQKISIETWSGIWSESSCRPNFRLLSMTWIRHKILLLAICCHDMKGYIITCIAIIIISRDNLEIQKPHDSDNGFLFWHHPNHDHHRHDATSSLS